MAERVFVLPDLGEGLEEAEVSGWLVSEGDAVELNQPFVEIETAKATVEIPAPFAGRIARRHADVGQTVAVGAPLATFEVEEVAVRGGGAAAPGSGSPAASRRPGPLRRDPAAGRAAATPAVRKLARDLGIDLSAVQGTGPEGRVTREDVELATAETHVVDLPGGGTWTVALTTDVTAIPVSPVRRAIADRLSKVAAIPQVTTFREVDCTALDACRRELDVSPLPVFVRALVEICGRHPMINASWDEDRILLFRDVHVGIATDTERGLVVPVVRDASSLGIGAIAGEIARLAESARAGSLSVGEAADATIAVSNTGSYGSEFGTPLLNPGHAVTIALGAIAPRALVVEDRVEARLACTISCTFDHRVLDGADVGRALTELVALLEDRERLRGLPR